MEENTNVTDTVENEIVTEKLDRQIDTENHPEVNQIGNDDSKKNQPEVSEKNTTPRILKAKKIVKKSLAVKHKAIKNKGSTQILRKMIIRKKKEVGDNAESSHNSDEKHISDNTQLNETKDELPKEKSMEAENNGAKESPLEKNKEIDMVDVAEQQEQKSKEKRPKRRRNRGRRNGMDKRVSKDKENGSSKDKEKSVSKDKSERLGGLIFMCNAKTKPDCFRYCVMGVSGAKKEDVLRIKPGLKLFLYDFDLKLLYGIYKASSSGGMKLEPKAFRGKFPAQVRFNIVADSIPLPESVFKKAIKDNYDEKHKFKTELTVGQVRKLTRLFRPIGTRSVAQPIYSSPKAIIREREAPSRVRGSHPHSRKERAVEHRYKQREEAPRDSFLMDSYRAYDLQGDRRNVVIAPHVNRTREPYEGDFEHRVLDPRIRSTVPALVENFRMDPLHVNGREHERYTQRVVSDHIEDPYASRRVFSDHTEDPYASRRVISDHIEDPYASRRVISDHIEDPYASRRVISDHIEDPYASRRVISDHIEDPYAERYGASSRDAYVAPLGRESITSSSYLVRGRPYARVDDLPRREMVHDRHYSRYSTVDAVSDYDRMMPYPGDKLEASPLRVSARYSFAGPSFSRR